MTDTPTADRDHSALTSTSEHFVDGVAERFSALGAAVNPVELAKFWGKTVGNIMWSSTHRNDKYNYSLGVWVADAVITTLSVLPLATLYTGLVAINNVINAAVGRDLPAYRDLAER